jgi:fibronectin type 3 domain-containing protein
VEPGTSNPRDLSVGGTTPGNGRERNLNSDQRLDTFMHMQGDDVPSFNGTPLPGSWEIAVPAGSYDVTVAVGDPQSNTDPEIHSVTVEGVAAITGFVPTGPSGSATHHAVATVPVVVTDGRLTIDAVGTNTKIDYVDIEGGAPDNEAPSAPTGLVATAGSGVVSLNWSDNPEPDLAGYNVYRSETLPVPTSTPLNASLVPGSAYDDATVQNDTTYHYVVTAVDLNGNESPASASAGGTPTAAAIDVKVNFQSAAAAIPPGYVRDFGQPYGARTLTGQGTGLTYGWVEPGTSTPRDLSVGGSTPGNGRDRNLNADQRLDTLMHMQANHVSGTFNGTPLPGSWEIAVPNGTYTATVAVGDPQAGADPEAHTINVEGNTAIDAFVPAGANGSATRHATATVTVRVQDGRLTLDAGGGTNTKVNYVDVASDAAGATRPAVTGITPATAATGVPRDSGIAATVSLPNVGEGVDQNTLDATSVQLVRASDQATVPANLNTSGGGDIIVIQPTVLLDPNTKYVVRITDDVHDTSGAGFLPFTSTFTTGTAGGPSGGGPASFEKVAGVATGQNFTSVTVGPDGKLYAATLEGLIIRYTIAADGTLTSPQTITSLQAANGGNRMLMGMDFDPAATAANPILWVTHSAYAFNGGPDWAGKLTRLSGPNLETVQDYVVNLPRSIRDHLTNGVQFGPDGKIYFLQGSNSAMGAPDNAWGNRNEHLLTAAVLVFDPSLVSTPPLDVKTEEGGTYNPFAPGAPLKLYATGTRNAWDLVWHSNGNLYVPTNGSAAGGNTPGTPTSLPASCQNRIDDATNGDYTGPQVPGITNVTATQNDFLFRVVQGGYYGHPNPSRCEWVLNGGNPTAGTDVAQVAQYPVGTQPDRNWRGSAYNFGNNKSPNGVIEYQSNLFGGSLKGKLLVIRYSQNDDVIALTPGASGDITAEQTGIPGLTGFVDPLDLTEDPATGNLYITELGAQRISLARAQSTGPGAGDVAVSPARLVFNDVQNGAASASQSVTIDNEGDEVLTVSNVSISGLDASQFEITGGPSFPAMVSAGGSITVTVAFDPTSIGPKGAFLDIATDDPETPLTQTVLRGLGTLGLGGANEPSLQWILDTWQIDVNVGDPDPTNNALPTTPLIGDEVSVPLFQRATDGPVTVEPLAVFGPDGANPVVNFGWYPAGNPGGRQQLFTVSNSPSSNAQTLNVPANGVTSFDPGTQSFGFSSIWPFFSNREVFQEDSRNTFSGAIPHHVRVYPLEDASGAVVPDAYVVATEETTSGFDYQDIVVIVRNVEPASPPNDSEISVENLDGVPFPDRLAFSRIGSLASPPSNGVHDVATVRIHNTGVDPLTVSSLQFSGPWQLNAPVSLPAQIAPGAFLDVAVKFVATSGSNHEGTLTIVSNDADEPSTVVELGGFWQSVSEGGQEPDISEIAEVFGYTTEIVGAGEDLNQNGLVTAVGEEILSPYWRRADPTKAVSVRQLAAYHTQGNTATVFFHAKGSTSTSTIFTHAGIDGQSILPRLSGQLGQPAAGSFTPASAVFGFKVDGEWSDPTMNNQSTDQANGCPTPCGHHVRFWPVRDRAGLLIPDTYLMSMDYSGINYDYNDNVYLISNITPEDPALDPTAQAPVPGAPSLVLDFDRAYPGSLLDSGGETIGFLGTQANELDTSVGSNSYQPALLDINTSGAGTLAVTTTIGSNANDDNTLVNGLQLPFDGTHGEFVVSARILGPVSQLNQGSRQGGVMFGRNQENYVKVVAINKGGAPSIEFFSEIGGTGATVGATPAIPNPATVETIDVALLADPDSRTVRAAYRAMGPGFDTGLVVLPTAVTLSGAAGGRFFEQQGRAGIITMHKGSASPITVTFDRFAVEAGDPTDGPDAREALHRLDVAGAGEYTDTNGDVWIPDTGLFSPAGAISEGAAVNPQEIANTDDDVIYRTYRGNVGNVPIAQRVLTYNIPTFGLEEMDLRLHFAERAAGNDLPGERVFDVEAEGDTILDDFDIVAASGGQHTAIVVPVNGVEVNDGSLTLVFRAVADYPSIAGIEVLCPGTCPEPDTTPPAAPTGLTATASPAGIALDWDNNTESDLAGYNVYRASSAGGPFTKITDSPTRPSQYLDATAPSGATSFYEVRAVDTSGNGSDPATADATMPVVESAIRINAGGTTQSTGGLTWEGCASAGACNGYVSGGFPYTEPGSPAIANVPAGMNQAIFQTEWTGGQTNGIPVGGTAFTFNVPVDAGNYLVRLSFAELNKNGAGLRVFDVNIEGGALELNDYDIWSKVGFRTATLEEFTTTVSDGSLTIQFVREIENAKVSAIEIVPLGSGVPGTTTARLNAGGGTQTVGALTWAGCASVGTCGGQVAGGFPYTEPGSPSIANVPAGMNQTIFQTEWTGGQTNGVPPGGTAFTFDIPVTNGDYVIKLYFAELNKDGAGLRVFDVNIEGGPLELNDYDIWSKVGYRTATLEQFTKTITDGSVTIQFVREIENAKISAIEIVPAAA